MQAPPDLRSHEPLVGHHSVENVMAQEKEKKVKRIKELFVQDLARIQGGTGTTSSPLKPHCPEITTFACGEEPVGCSGC
jgi:hypothetical protein